MAATAMRLSKQEGKEQEQDFRRALGQNLQVEKHSQGDEKETDNV